MKASRLLALGLLAPLAGAASALAASGATGNAHAIAIARSEARAYARIPAETYTETGYIQMDDQEGKTSFLRYYLGLAKLRPGYVWATEHGIVALRHGRVVWARDDLAPPPCTGVGACHQIPVELVMMKSGAYYAFGNAAHHTCFGRLSGGLPVTVGAPWSKVMGHYLAPVMGRHTIKLTYTYRLSTGASVRQTDTLSRTSYLMKSSRIAAGGLHVSYRARQPAKAPRAPRINLCSG
ncbi:MAG TPA: hypothetical protein VE992_03225 [Solirubrobacteraceae bacterium]|nr:hypothetical protein [Solirubrobacteraceae bacterium]